MIMLIFFIVIIVLCVVMIRYTIKNKVGLNVASAITLRPGETRITSLIVSWKHKAFYVSRHSIPQGTLDITDQRIVFTATSGTKVNFEVEKDDISITAEYAAVGGEYMLTGNYTVVIAGKYFSSRDTAQAFIRGIAERAVSDILEKAASIDFSIDDEVFAEASFDDKIVLLEEQRGSILASYDEWMEEYRASYSVGGKTLSAYRAEAAVSCAASTLRSLREELESCGYVSLEEMNVRLEELEREYSLNEDKIAALRETLDSLPEGSGSGTSADGSVAQMIAELVVRNVQIKNEMSALNENDITAFEGKMQKMYSSMQTAAKNLRSVTVALYEQETTVHFMTYRAVVSGDTSLALVAVAGLVLGFLIAAIVVCRIEYGKEKRAAAQNADTPSEDAPSENGTSQDA